MSQGLHSRLASPLWECAFGANGKHYARSLRYTFPMFHLAPRHVTKELPMAKAPKKTPDLDYILLCLIRMRPDISGYQLRTIINESTGFFFHAHLSQIYPALRRLTEQGLVEFSQVKRESQPDLKLYRITDAGCAVSSEWLTRPFPFENTRANTDRYFLKLILMGHLEPEEIVRYIDQGIEAFTAERESTASGNLQTERAYAQDIESPAHERYLTIWDHEFSFVLREFDERIEWLRALRAEFVDE